MTVNTGKSNVHVVNFEPDSVKVSDFVFKVDDSVIENR